MERLTTNRSAISGLLDQPLLFGDLQADQDRVRRLDGEKAVLASRQVAGLPGGQWDRQQLAVIVPAKMHALDRVICAHQGDAGQYDDMTMLAIDVK